MKTPIVSAQPPTTNHQGPSSAFSKVNERAKIIGGSLVSDQEAWELQDGSSDLHRTGQKMAGLWQVVIGHELNMGETVSHSEWYQLWPRILSPQLCISSALLIYTTYVILAIVGHVGGHSS